MRVCYECGYHGPERTCPHDGLPTFDEGGDLTRVAPAARVGGVFAERYEVVRELGVGGTGSAYLARHRAMHGLGGRHLRGPDGRRRVRHRGRREHAGAPIARPLRERNSKHGERQRTLHLELRGAERGADVGVFG